MNFLKSIFISCFVTWLLLLSVYALTQLARGMEPLPAWLGLALTAVPPLTFFLKAFIFKTPRTPRHPFEYTLMSGAGLAITMAMSYRYGPAAGWIHVWAGITLLGWLAYLRWYSVFHGRDARSLKVSSTLPDFQVENEAGDTVSSQSFRSGPHLLIFFRGNWCPFCSAQIKEIAAAYQQLDAMGVTVVLISPQSAKKNAQMASRLAVPMVFLRDRNNTAAKHLGIEHAWGTPMGMQLLGYDSDTVLPTVIATDTHGKIIYLDQTDNYRVRPEPATFEAIFKQALQP